jgi:hypothetical protein
MASAGIAGVRRLIADEDRAQRLAYELHLHLH